MTTNVSSVLHNITRPLVARQNDSVGSFHVSLHPASSEPHAGSALRLMATAARSAREGAQQVAPEGSAGQKTQFPRNEKKALPQVGRRAPNSANICNMNSGNSPVLEWLSRTDPAGTLRPSSC